MTAISAPPSRNQLEVTVLGPGYGESIAIHIGNGDWVIVDSCIDSAGDPRSLRYLRDLGVNPASAVKLIVATHWHDDHIRGIARLLEACQAAEFCCAGALLKHEFLSVIGALENRGVQTTSSGVREMYEVISQLDARNQRPRYAIADRRVFLQNGCEIWTLSPSDSAFQQFLRHIGEQQPERGKRKQRLSTLSPNKLSVVLWMRIEEAVLLLGADMEKPGWTEILESDQRPGEKASLFKIPHHGSRNADEPDVWKYMVKMDPYAVLTPWRLAGRFLPQKTDVQRILGNTSKAYSTSKISSLESSPAGRDRAVRRTVRESGIALRSLRLSSGAVRFRRSQQNHWQVEKFGSACDLAKMAA